MSDEDKPIAVPAEDGSVERLAEPGRALRHRVEHRLDVRRRARDHTEDVASGRLLGQGLGQLDVAHLQFLEQADVLDGDDGLVGEGFEQRDLIVGERLGHQPPYHDDPDRQAFSQQRRGEHGPDAERGKY
jgi:hypothetical protein